MGADTHGESNVILGYVNDYMSGKKFSNPEDKDTHITSLMEIIRIREREIAEMQEQLDLQHELITLKINEAQAATNLIQELHRQLNFYNKSTSCPECETKTLFYTQIQEGDVTHFGYRCTGCKKFFR